MVKRSRFEKMLFPFGAVLLLPLLLMFRVLFTGKVLYWGLPALQFVPWQAFAWEQIQQGALPLWNPLNGMGAPLLANYQLAIFYPPSWLLYGFAAVGGVEWLAWANGLVVYGHLVWAGWGMAKLVRQLGGKELAQTIAGLSFSLSGFLTARLGFFSIIWAAAWMPWVLMFASRIASPVRQQEDGRDSGLLPVPLVLCTVMMLLAGHAQVSWYIALYTVVWVFTGALFHFGIREAFFSMVRLGAAFVWAALISAIQLLPTLEYLRLSQRTAAVEYETAMAYSLWPWKAITFLAPNFFGNPGLGNYWGYASFHEDGLYIGMLSFILALSTLGVLFSRGKGQQAQGRKFLIVLLWGMIAAGLVLALGRFTPIFPFLFQYVPTFDMFHGPVRIMIWVVFSLAVLAAIAAEWMWERPAGRRLYWTRLATAGAAAVTIGAFAGWYFFQEISPTFIQATAFAGLWGLGLGLLTLFKPTETGRASRSLKIWQVGVVFWLGVDLLAAGWWLNPLINRNFYAAHSETTQLAQAAKNGRVYQSLADNYRLKFKRFVRVKDYQPLEPVSNLREIGLPNANLLDHISFVNNFDPFSPERYARWMDELQNLPEESQKAWLSIMNVAVVQVVNAENPLGVDFVPLSPRPRFEWVGCAIAVESAEAAWHEVHYLLGRAAEERTQFVVIEDAPSALGCMAGGAGEVDVLEDLPNRVVLAVDSQQEGWLVMRDVWYPGWKVKVDGHRRPMYRADYLFRGVALSPGEHVVVFEYRPVSFWGGLGISIFSIGLLLWQIKAQAGRRRGL